MSDRLKPPTRRAFLGNQQGGMTTDFEMIFIDFLFFCLHQVEKHMQLKNNSKMM